MGEMRYELKDRQNVERDKEKVRSVYCTVQCYTITVFFLDRKDIPWPNTCSLAWYVEPDAEISGIS